MALFLAASACGLAIGLKVSGKHMDITPALQSHADEKLLKHLNKYENFVTSCTVNLKVEQRGGGLHDTAHKGLEAHVAELEAGAPRPAELPVRAVGARRAARRGRRAGEGPGAARAKNAAGRQHVHPARCTTWCTRRAAQNCDGGGGGGGVRAGARCKGSAGRVQGRPGRGAPWPCAGELDEALPRKS